MATDTLQASGFADGEEVNLFPATVSHFADRGEAPPSSLALTGATANAAGEVTFADQTVGATYYLRGASTGRWVMALIAFTVVETL